MLELHQINSFQTVMTFSSPTGPE